MNKALVSLAVALLAMTPGEVNGQVNLGVFGGASLIDLTGDAPEGAKYNSSTGFASGILGEFLLKDDIWLSLQPMYVERGSDLLVGFSQGSEPDTLGFALDYFTLPILLKFVSGNGKTYAASGIDIGFLASATLSDDSTSTDVRDSLNDIDLSADFALGLMLPIGRPALTLEARYTQSILNVAKRDPDFEPGVLPSRFRSSGFELFGGLVVPLGRKSVTESPGRRAGVPRPAARVTESRRPGGGRTRVHPQRPRTRPVHQDGHSQLGRDRISRGYRDSGGDHR